MSDFKNDEDMTSAVVPEKPFSIKTMMPESDWDVELVELAYEHIPIPFVEKTTLSNDLIEPVAANLSRILSDAHAWDITGNNLIRVANNIEINARRLGRDWNGAAADAFANGLAAGWIAPLIAGGGICKLISKGLKTVYHGCAEAIGALATKLVPAIVRMLEKIAIKAVPGVGWAWELVESLVNWEVPYKDEIEKVVGMIGLVIQTHEAVEKLTALINKYKAAFEGFMDLLNSLGSIDAVGPSGASVVGMVKDMKAIGEATEAYYGEIETDEDGNVVRNDDGTLKLKKSEHTAAIESIKTATEDIKDRLDRTGDKARKGKL